MNIAKFNPIGYESKTDKGNTYKKSNLFKSLAIVEAGTAMTAPKLIKNERALQIIQMFLPNPKLIVEQLELMFGEKLPTKYKSVLIPAMWIFDIGGTILGGLFVDSRINKKRAKKADELNTQA
ncbi:hypothetical protein IJ579_00470 [bacterium]|nr:hypothetical protein [bacterium]